MAPEIALAEQRSCSNRHAGRGGDVRGGHVGACQVARQNASDTGLGEPPGDPIGLGDAACAERRPGKLDERVRRSDPSRRDG